MKDTSPLRLVGNPITLSSSFLKGRGKSLVAKVSRKRAPGGRTLARPQSTSVPDPMMILPETGAVCGFRCRAPKRPSRRRAVSDGAARHRLRGRWVGVGVWRSEREARGTSEGSEVVDGEPWLPRPETPEPAQRASALHHSRSCWSRPAEWTASPGGSEPFVQLSFRPCRRS